MPLIVSLHRGMANMKLATAETLHHCLPLVFKVARVCQSMPEYARVTEIQNAIINFLV